VGSYKNTKTQRRNGKVKYVKFFEVSIEDLDEMIEKWGKYLEKSKKTPEKYPTYVFPPHGLGKLSKGVSIIEADKEEQLINYMLELSPPLKIKFVPLIDSSKAMEIYMKTRK
jgi:hypothetical protein